MPSPLTRIASAATATARSVREPPPGTGLAEREADFLPVPYFHVVFTFAGRDCRHRLPEQGGDL